MGRAGEIVSFPCLPLVVQPILRVTFPRRRHPTPIETLQQRVHTGTGEIANVALWAGFVCCGSEGEERA